MNAYIEKALSTYCDTSQTSSARQIAHAVLINAGMTESDLQALLQNDAQTLPIMIFLA